MKMSPGSGYPSVLKVSFFIVAIGLLDLFGPSDANAQNRGRESVAINISLNGNDRCVYAIAGQENQDSFIVRPNAKLSFSASGIKAKVNIKGHPGQGEHAGAKGTAQSSSFTVADTKTVRRNARSGIGSPTTHKVEISCLDAEGNVVGGPSIDAASAGTASLLRPVWDHSESNSANISGPNSSDFVLPIHFESELDEAKRRGEGGPGMEVEDP